jgi:hypothetical protein
MSFDEAMLESAQKDLETTEKLCSGSMTKKKSGIKKILSSSLKSSNDINAKQVHVTFYFGLFERNK